MFELQNHLMQSHIRGLRKQIHNMQQMPCRWGNDYDRAPVLLHSLCYYRVDTHSHTTDNCASSCWHTQAHRWPYWSSLIAWERSDISNIQPSLLQAQPETMTSSLRDDCECLYIPLDGAVVNRLWDAWAVMKNEEPFDLCILMLCTLCL